MHNLACAQPLSKPSFHRSPRVGRTGDEFEFRVRRVRCPNPDSRIVSPWIVSLDSVLIRALRFFRTFAFLVSSYQVFAVFLRSFVISGWG